MDWMYKGVSGLADREEYLTGRKVDKTFEIISKEENNNIRGDLDAFEPSIPESVFDVNQSQTNSSAVTIDLATKLREDPLYEIRVKQREQRRRLLDNPLKLKKLRNILESTLTEDKHKKWKKKKKHRESDSDSSDSDHRRRRRDRDYKRSDRKSGRHSDDSSRHKSYESNRDKDRNRDKRDSERRPDHRYEQKIRHESRDDRRRIEKRLDDKNSSNQSRNRSKLSAEELEKKRKEMIENAFWRECQRKSNVQSYADEEKKELELNSSGKSAQFIKPLLKSAAESDSLEDRIKQKRFRSQRSHNSMDNNFAKK